MEGTPQHPDERRLKLFMRGVPLPEEEKRAIVQHLLTGCPACVMVTRKYWGLGEWPAELKDLVVELTAPFRRRTVLEGRPHAV
jgi:hypothetical protein